MVNWLGISRTCMCSQNSKILTPFPSVCLRMPKHIPFNHPPDWEDRIAKALAALALDSSLPIRKAAARQEIPDTTLGYRLNKVARITEIFPPLTEPK